jgi:hypothetical protein
MSLEMWLQREMFTGELVDNRTAAQKKADREQQIPVQCEMFSIHDTVQIGACLRPWLFQTPKSPLVLVGEDPRTEEEIEHDLMREAERLTNPMFAEQPAAPEATQTPEAQDDVFTPTGAPETAASPPDDEDEEPAEPLAPPVSKHAAYLALVNAAEERATTLSHTPTTELAETIAMSAAKLNAQLAGLTGDEIAAALTIGDFRGRAKPIIEKAEQASPLPHPEAPGKDWDVPVLWTNRAEMVKRRPDLAARIQALRDDEVEALAALLSDALEEFYWIQLNVILSLCLDHELKLLRRGR